MAVGDRRMFADDQLRPAAGLVSEVTRGTKWKTGDPIAATDRCMRFKMKKIDIFADGRASNSAALLHDQPIRQNPAKPDSRGGMNLIAELFFKKRPPQLPRQKKTEQHQD